MATKVLILTQWFDPEPTPKGLGFAQELVRQGLDVEVVTGFPNYPGGKLYAGYKLKWLQRERMEGVHVTRVPLYLSHSQSAVGRILNYLSFSASALFYGLCIAKRPDIIYAYHPPLTVGIAASLIRIMRGVPVVYDIQDMWPDTLRASGMFSNERALRVVSWVCDWLYKRVDHLVVLSPGFKRLLIQRGVPEKKIDVILNWSAHAGDEVSALPLPADFPGPEIFRILYAGNIGKMQGLISVLDAAEMLRDESSNLMFLFLGGGVEIERLKLHAEKKVLNNVVFLPAVPLNEVSRYLAAADALLVHLRRDPLFEITIPSKTQVYMASGKPILMAVDGDAADLVKLSHCGIATESENPRAIANAAVALFNCGVDGRQRMGSNGMTYYRDHLSIAIGVASFIRIFDRVRAGRH